MFLRTANFAYIRQSNSLLGAVILILCAVFITPAQAQNDFEAEIKMAREKYAAGDFDTAITLLRQCLRQNDLAAAHRMQACHGLAQAYMAKNALDEAKQHLLNMMALAPDYQPDPEQEPPSFIALVNEVKFGLMAQRLAQTLAQNCPASKNAPLRIAPGHFAYQNSPVSSPLLHGLQERLTAALDDMPQFEMVTMAELQNAVKMRGIDVFARLQPNSPEAVQTITEADAVLLGEAWERGDSLALVIKLVQNNNQQPLSLAKAGMAKSALPANLSIRPANFEQAQQIVAGLQDAASGSTKLEIKLWVDRLNGAIYREGEEMAAYVRANKECYVNLIYHDASSADFLIFPNQHETDNRLAANQVYEILGPSRRFRVVVAPPFGVEILKVFASTQPLAELNGEKITGAGIKRLQSSLAEMTTAMRGVSVSARPAERAEASCVVTTVQLPQ